MIEMLCVIAIIAILAALLLPVVTQGQARARRLQCVNNLKETGVAFHAYAHDHNGRFPMEVPTREGGSLEFVQNAYHVTGEFYFSFRHFQALSNELVTPKLLHCPAEATRLAATRFSAMQNENLSYFVGVMAVFDKPNSILAGDRNITNDWPQNPSIVRSSSARPVRWTQELHKFKGNLLFADGHVQEVNDARWADYRMAINGDLFLPSLQPPTAVASSPAPRPPGGPSERPAPSSRPAAAAGSRTGKGGTSLLMLVEAREPAPAPTPALAVTVRETNTLAPAAPAAPASPSRPAASAPVSGEAPFMLFLAEMADAIRIPVWLLYLFLVLMLAGLMTMLLRRRPR